MRLYVDNAFFHSYFVLSFLKIDVRVINDLIEDLGRLETAKSQVQNRINTGNPSNLSDTQQQPSWQHPSLNHRSRFNSERIGTSASTPGFGSKSSINQIPTKKMMDNEIEGVQFNRKRMNSTISNSSGGRSMDTPSKFGDQVIF